MDRNDSAEIEPPELIPGESPEIDAATLEKLAQWGCSIGEAAAWHQCSIADMRAALKDPHLKEAWRCGRGRGQAELRRAQFNLAKSNATIAALVGRRLLGQREPSDKPATVIVTVDTGIRRDDAQD